MKMSLRMGFVEAVRVLLLPIPAGRESGGEFCPMARRFGWGEAFLRSALQCLVKS